MDEPQITAGSEFPEELEQLDNRLQLREPQMVAFYWPNEQAIVDVTQTIGFLECNGLYAFWSGDLNQERIIRSFRKVTGDTIADLLNESRWAKPLIETGDYDRRFEEFGEERMNEFSRIEKLIFAEFKKTHPKILAFAKLKKVTGRPLNIFERMIAWGTSPSALFLTVLLKCIPEERKKPRRRKSKQPDSTNP